MRFDGSEEALLLQDFGHKNHHALLILQNHEKLLPSVVFDLYNFLEL